MSDYEGSRSEFLKLLAEMGEEPAFIARPLAPGDALEALLQACEAKRNELLKWPKFHLAALAQRVRGDWSRLGSLLAGPEDVALAGGIRGEHAGELAGPVRLADERSGGAGAVC